MTKIVFNVFLDFSMHLMELWQKTFCGVLFHVKWEPKELSMMVTSVKQTHSYWFWWPCPPLPRKKKTSHRRVWWENEDKSFSYLSVLNKSTEFFCLLLLFLCRVARNLPLLGHLRRSGEGYLKTIIFGCHYYQTIIFGCHYFHHRQKQHWQGWSQFGMTGVFISVACMVVNHGPSQHSTKEEYKLWKWGATTRYYASPTKTMLPMRKSVPRSSRQSDRMKTWPL